MREAQEHSEASGPSRTSRLLRLDQPLAPLLLLLAFELLIALALAAWAPAPIEGARVAAVVGLLALGLAPSLLRPSWDSVRVVNVQVLLAALLWHGGATAGLTSLSLAELAGMVADPRVALCLVHAALVVPLVIHIVARFPRRNAISDWLLGAAYVGYGALAAAAVLAPPDWRLALLVVLVVGSYGGFAVAGLLLVWAIRDPRPEQRQQLAQARLLFVGLLLAIAPLLSLPAIRLFGGNVPPALLTLVLICFPAATLYALLHRDLLGIDITLRRALGYTATSVGLLALYFGLTLTLTTLLRGLTPSGAPLITVLSVLGAASAFPWLQKEANRLITRVFYPERISLLQELAAVREALGQVVHREEAVALLTEVLPERLGVEWARLQLAADAPPAGGGAWSAPLLVGGRQLGVYWLGPRRSGLPFAPDEQERLRAVAQQAALALAYAESYEALAALNAELEDRVAARSEQLLAHQRELATVAERQRLARDLHDSLKQTLFSLGLNLHGAVGLVERDPERARRLIAQQAERVVQAQSELAELLSDLRSLGAASTNLSAALRHETTQLELQHGFRVALDLPPQLDVQAPAARELAAVAREALHNALKHSGTDAARLSVTTNGRDIVLAVADDGRGFDLGVALRSGHGLRGMRERMEALGGTLTIATAEGEGARLWVRIPSQVQSES